MSTSDAIPTNNTAPADVYIDMPNLNDMPGLEEEPATLERLNLARTLSTALSAEQIDSINAASIKEMTGNEPIVARKLHLSDEKINVPLIKELTGVETYYARTGETVQLNVPEPVPEPTTNTIKVGAIATPHMTAFTYTPIDAVKTDAALANLLRNLPNNQHQAENLFLGTLLNLDKYNKFKADPSDENKPTYSDVCNWLPGLKSLSGHIAKELAYAFLNLLHNKSVTSESDMKERQSAYVHYTKLKAMLKREYTEQLTAKNLATKSHNYGMCKLSKYHKARVSVPHYEEAKTMPLSEQITKPTPMEVQVAPISELQAIFDRLAANDPALPVKSDEIGSYEQYSRGAYYTDGRIDMCKQVVGPDHIGKLCDSIRYNEHIKHFLLGNNIAGYVGAACIAALINDQNKKCKISTWYLAGNCIDSAGMELIAGALTYDTDCKHLWLKRNPIGVTGAKAIAKMFATNNTIEVLDLDNTAVFDEGCVEIFTALKNNTSLRSIYLDANGLTQASATAIADYFRHKVETGQPGIKQLSLSINRFGDEGIAMIIDSLFGYPLTSLTIGSNRIELAGLKSVLSWAVKTPTLEVLDIGYYKATADMGELPNSFGNDGARLIACFILLNTPVRYLSFHNSHITDLSVIEAVMPFNTNLVAVTCEQGTTSSKIVHKIIERNQSVHYPGKSVKEIVRNMKHGTDVWVIDSIYRNKM
jgi:hypothetical protein